MDTESLTLTDAKGGVMDPAPVTNGTADFARLQDKMRAEANGEGTDEVPAPPDRPEGIQPKPKPKGRPRKVDTARTTSTTEPAKAGKAAVKDDYSADASALVQGAWLGMALVPPAKPYAAILGASADALAASLAEGAKHSSIIRGLVSGGGGSMWMLQLAGVVMTMGVQALQVAKDPELRAQLSAATDAQLVKTLNAAGIEVPAAE